MATINTITDAAANGLTLRVLTGCVPARHGSQHLVLALRPRASNRCQAAEPAPTPGRDKGARSVAGAPAVCLVVELAADRRADRGELAGGALAQEGDGHDADDGDQRHQE